MYFVKKNSRTFPRKYIDISPSVSILEVENPYVARATPATAKATLMVQIILM